MCTLKHEKTMFTQHKRCGLIFHFKKVEVSQWVSEGLPADELSIQNGILTTRGRFYHYFYFLNLFLFLCI